MAVAEGVYATKSARRAHLADPSAPDHREAVENIANYLSLVHLLSRSIDKMLAEGCALSTLQYRILLRLLSAGERHVCASDLAANLHVGLSTVSAAMQKLVEAGKVDRAGASDDMRVFELELTSRGRAAIREADEQVGKFLEAYWHRLTREQLETAIASSLSAAALHDAERVENGRLRLDTAFFDAVMTSRTLTACKLATLGFKTVEFRILVDLYLRDEEVACSQVARHLFLSSGDVTSPIKRLESTELLTKRCDASNRRMKKVALTQAGRTSTVELLPQVFDALLETCHSDEAAIRIHLEAARHVIAQERASVFA
ncbi:MAG: MarR family transcriptional regulator [Eggerthellaceae bacterium]|nr:MarR family transcriptional regulator [Eggerthellaceae bacterium]